MRISTHSLPRMAEPLRCLQKLVVMVNCNCPHALTWKTSPRISANPL